MGKFGGIVNWDGAVKLFANLSRFSARHPIEVIVVTLLCSSVAYLSVIQYYLKEWEQVFKNELDPYSFNKQQLLQECTHYYHSSGSNTWNTTPFLPSDAFKDIKHYFLYTYTFQNQKPRLVLPDLNNVIYETNMTKYILTDSLYKPEEYINVNSIPIWEMETTKEYLVQFKYQLIRFIRNVMFSNNLEQTDVLLILLTYVIVLCTVLDLFQKMRKEGSKFWLSLCLLINSTCAFFLASFTMLYIFKKPTSTLTLAEGLPFFLVLVGFKDKVKLSSYTIKRFGVVNISKRFTADKIIFDTFNNASKHLFQFYLTLISCAISGIIYFKGIDQVVSFLILTICILVYDFLLMTTFYSSILCLKIEINIINRSTIIRQALEEEGTLKNEPKCIKKNLGLGATSFFKSRTTIFIGKLSIICLLLGINLYNVNIRWIFNTLKSIILSLRSTELPEAFVSQVNSISFQNKNVIISVVPAVYYQPLQDYQNYENITMLFLRYLGTIISDKLISKFIFLISVLSITTNAYLLRIAKIHSDATISELCSKSIKLNKSNDVKESKALLSPILQRIEISKSPTPAVFSLEASDDETSESSESSTLVSGRSYDDCVHMLESGRLKELRNSEIANLIITNKIPLYSLEKKLEDTTRAVEIRREAIAVLARLPSLNTKRVPYKDYDYDRVFGACCENVVGYIPLPLGIMGPLIVDGKPYHIPMATTEGCLIASAMRGCKAINAGGGATTVLTKDGMTRGPCVRFPSLLRSGACKLWLDSVDGQDKIREVFNSTSRFARLQHIQTAIAGDLLFIRFRTTTGDAMGMNMISKGVEYSLLKMIEEFGWEDMEIISVSGNYCTDKKPAAINWIEGRGKSVYAEATIPRDVVSNVLKSDAATLAELNVCKNLIGSAMAGSVGGFNAHAANMVTAIFLALGQDPAQNVESSNCMTIMNEINGDLKISVSMPSIEVGTIGGGTILEAQGAMLDLLGVRGPNQQNPGENARQLAKVIACAVMAAELSLCAALGAGQLVQSHMIHNRAKTTNLSRNCV